MTQKTKSNLADFKNAQNIFVISDLHLSEGISPITKHWNRLEDFTAHDAFVEFLDEKLEVASKSKPQSWLIINGDFVDFLRILRVPDKNDLKSWRDALWDLTSAKLPHFKERVISEFDKFAYRWQKYILNPKCWQICPADLRSEKRFGLKTQDFKSVFRLLTVFEGHKAVFEALANWLKVGNNIAIISGNHDLEFNQTLVQACFCWKLEEIAKADSTDALNFSDKLQFFARKIEIDDSIHIEHGQDFEWHTRTGGKWQLNAHDKNQELRLPPGSLFNRYLVNKIELKVPNLNNVRPNGRVLLYLLKNHQWSFIKILWQLLKTVLRLMNKSGARRLILLGIMKVGMVVLPLAYFIRIFYAAYCSSDAFFVAVWKGANFLQHVIPFYVSFPIVALVTVVLYLLGKKHSPNFEKEITEHINKCITKTGTKNKRIFIYGHTHKPDIQFWDKGKVEYINSGTWIPIFEYESGIVRKDLTKTFVELEKTATGWKAKLARWLPFHQKEAAVILVEQRNK
jgi:UDP-2,3-diacylglucosamine pyrophosphatase LpxH